MSSPRDNQAEPSGEYAQPRAAGFAAAFPATPSPEWARENPDNFLRFLFVSPRPCEALDELLKPN